MKNINRMSDDLWILCLGNLTHETFFFPSKYRLTRCEVRENQYHKLPLISLGLMQLRKEFYEGLYPRGL